MSGSVYVFGSINADTSYRMPALPAPGETVVARAAVASPGGKGANQAIASAAAGAATRMIGAVGDDGIPLLDALAARGVDTSSVAEHAGALTGRAVVFVDDSGENSIVVLPSANDLLDERAALAGLHTLSSGDTVVLQNEVPAAANRAAARIARAAGASVVWNAAPAPAAASQLVDAIDLLVVNEHELTQIGAILGVAPAVAGSGIPGLMELLAASARALSSDAVCTLGADGAIFVAAGESGRVEAPRVRAVDTTAAGDTVVGYLAAHSALPIRERLALAARAGALTVTREGASSSIPRLTDVERMLVDTTERTPA
jgi:ribokinase